MTHERRRLQEVAELLMVNGLRREDPASWTWLKMLQR